MFAPRYFAVRFYGSRYFPPSSDQQVTGAIGVLYKRDADIYVSKATSTTTDSANTVKLNVTDFSYNRRVISNTIGRETLQENQNRGISSYIDAVMPVEFSFSTYGTPFLELDKVSSVEEYLWVGLKGRDDIISGSEQSNISFSTSNVSTLNELTLWFNHPNRARGSFRLDNAIIDSATINFDINNITTIDWKGRALGIVGDKSPPANYTDRTDKTSCLKNKLTTMTLNLNNTDYSLAIVGGSITIDNNNKFYGRKLLGETLVPTGHYTGNRTVQGNFEVYLRAGSLKSIDLLETIYNYISTNYYESSYLANITFNIAGEDAPNIIVNVPSALIESGLQNFNEVITASFDFTAQEQDGSYISVIYQAPGGTPGGGSGSSYFPEDYFPETYYPKLYFPF